MTTIAVGRLSETLQNLVDARLDTIDRMLLGRVNRQDRLAIVREVETQIFDLIQGRDAEALDRDDILAVLARLDPPEAYLTEETTGEVRELRISRRSPPLASSSRTQSRLPITSGLLGIVSAVMILFSWILSLFLEFDEYIDFYVAFISTGFSFLLGLMAVIMAGRVRHEGRWALTGLLTGILSILAAVTCTMKILRDLWLY